MVESWLRIWLLFFCLNCMADKESLILMLIFLRTKDSRVVTPLTLFLALSEPSFKILNVFLTLDEKTLSSRVIAVFL